MRRIPIDFYNRLVRGEVPIAYILIYTHLGYRAYAQKELSGFFDIAADLLDGTWTLDGSETLGSDSIGVIDKAARVIDFGDCERSISPRRDDVLTAYVNSQQQSLSVTLADADGYFSRMIASVPFLGRTMWLYAGFEAMSQASHLKLFEGRITEITSNQDGTMVLDAEAR